MHENIIEVITKLLQSVDVPPDMVSYGESRTADVKLTFSVNWFFEVNVKDTLLNSVMSSDTVLSEDALNDVQKANTDALLKDANLKRPFCTGLENKSAAELFKICNKINRISARHAKGDCTCPSCKGTKKISCPNCSGYGMILCPSCQGREGGCTRCNKTGYISCPTCNNLQKIVCQNCKGKGRVLVDRMVCLLARNFPVIDVEVQNMENVFAIPNCHVDYACYFELLKKLPFKLIDAEFKESGVFLITYVAECRMDYVTFDISKVSKSFSFYTCGDNFTPLNIPPVLESIYSDLKMQLSDAAIGNTLTDMDTKIELFKTLCQNRFFYGLLCSFEFYFDLVTRRLQNEVVKTDNYTSKIFTMREKLQSLMAYRKEQLADELSKKLLMSTNNLMKENFSKDICLSLVEYISNLKFREHSGRHYWDMVTSFIWVITFMLNFFIHSPVNLVACILFGIVASFLVAYFGTKTLKFYEVMLASKTFEHITKFIDFNYDLSRSIALLSGTLIIEIITFFVT